ncbi:MAG: DeoR/GlpR family DNA-binding transcription regulator [Chloroflexi bacterium]|nr:DeoR/GlpR family DNA-binding transcription regulator [Chloroflexota bacterium]
MLPEARRRHLLSYLARVRSAGIADLSARYHVSSMTIRRDLKQLQSEGLVTLTHGGVVFDGDAPEPQEIQRLTRDRDQADEKRAIGRHAAMRFVKDNDVLLLGAGSTVRAVVPFLKHKGNLQVVSNSLRTIELLRKTLPSATVMGTGGLLRADSLSFDGPVTERFFEDFFARVAFLSGAGLSLRAGLTDPQLLEASVKQAMTRSSEKTVVLLDSSKLGTTAAAQILAIDEIETLVTDADIAPDAQGQLLDIGIDVQVAPLPSRA